MLLGMLIQSRARSLSLHHSDRAFGYALGIDAASEGNATLEESDARRVGCAELWKAEVPRCLSFLLLAQKSVEEKGGHAWKRAGTCRDLWKGRGTSLVYVCSCLYRQLVYLLSVTVGERAVE